MFGDNVTPNTATVSTIFLINIQKCNFLLCYHRVRMLISDDEELIINYDMIIMETSPIVISDDEGEEEEEVQSHL